MKFEDKYFAKFSFTKEQIDSNLKNSFKDLNIAKSVEILEVKFSYSYSALLKAGIALLGYYNFKVKSVPGHHVKIIEKMSKILKDERVSILGNIMRSKRNIDFYSGGVEITAKECSEYLSFVENTINKIKDKILE